MDRRLCVNEVLLYESQIAEVLAQTKAAGHRFTVEVSERQVVVEIEISDALFADTVWFVESLKREIEPEFLARLGIEADVHFVQPRSRSEGEI